MKWAFLKKRASDLVLSSGDFKRFRFIEIFQSQIKIHRKCHKTTKISKRLTFCGQFPAIFQLKSANSPLKA